MGQGAVVARVGFVVELAHGNVPVKARLVISARTSGHNEQQRKLFAC